MKIYDVSMPIVPDMPVYKNKEQKKPVIQVVQDFDTAPARESKVTMDVHCGTHVDSPLHMLPDGGTMKTIPLEHLIGHARGLDFSHVEGGVGKEDLEAKGIQAGEFLLLKTKNSGKDEFDFEIVYLKEDGAKYLAEKQIRGVGIDALGIERSQPGHPTHKTLFKAGVIIMEGLRLKEVPEGTYFMVAAPIKLMETEAAPARVILMKDINE